MMKETVMSQSLRLMFSGGMVLGLGVIAQPALAQDAGAAATAEPMQRVEVTGSSIRRLAGESALPVSVLKREDIARTGATSAQDLVGLIPGNFGGTVASGNVSTPGVASTANLHALGAKYTLVLLNGRRVASFAVGNSVVDLNSIPLSAIERVEVLRDGASAVYGADAVAGVINFILRQDYHGLEATVYDTDVRRGGGNTKSLNVTGGFGSLQDDRYNVLISVNHEENQQLRAVQRDFASTAYRPDLGINKASVRNGIPNLNFTDTNGNAYSGVNPYRYTNCDNPAFALVTVSAAGCGTDYVKFVDLIPKAKHDNLVSRAVFQVNDDNQVYAEANYTKDHSVTAYAPAPYVQSMVYPAGGRFYPSTITLPKGLTLKKGYKMPDGSVLAADTVLANDLAVTPTGPITGTWRTVGAGPRSDIIDTTGQRFVVGAKGTLMNWDYDTAVSYAKNKVDINFGSGFFSYAKLGPLLASGEIDVFGAGDATSQARLQEAAVTGFENGGTATTKEVDFRMSKADLFTLPYGAVGFSVGAVYRDELLDQVSSPTLASGDAVGANGAVPSVVGGRKVYGLFSEVVVPVYKDLEATLAARYDRYKNDFGTAFGNLSPKIGLSYRPTSSIMLRGSAARGFRAPTLFDNLQPTAQKFTNSSYSDPVRCPNGVPVTSRNAVGALQDECKTQLAIQTGGNMDLEPEKSKQFSLGLVFQPSASFSGSIDYWNVKIDKAINTKPENAVFGNAAANANLFVRYDPQSPEYLLNRTKTPIYGSVNPDFPLLYAILPKVNTGKSFAAGWDLNLNYRKNMAAYGNFGANLDSTLYTRHGYQYEGSPEVSDLGVYKDFGPSPRYRQALSFTYGLGAWNASLTHNYTSGYEDYTDLTAISASYPLVRKVSATSLIDATLGWKARTNWLALKNLSVTLGVKNLQDKDPASSRSTTSSQVGYDQQFSNPLGRVLYLRLNAKFL